MLFTWWKNRRRRAILREPFPDAWLAILRNVGHYRLLAGAEQARLRDTVQILCAEKDWEGCRALELTDEVRVTIAGLAAVLLLGLTDFYFDNVQTILVYPDDFRAPRDVPMGSDVALHDEIELLGEARADGSVLLSWTEVHAEADDPGHGENLVFHEFAHQLDHLNGELDGTPRLPEGLRKRWADVMDRAYRALCRSAELGHDTLLDPYGATEPAEFFAVATEAFFDAPVALQAQQPQLYALFRDYYRQDPAAWPWPKL